MKVKKTAIFLGGLIFVIFSLALIFLLIGVYVPKDFSGQEQSFIVESGETLSGIAQRLEKEGIVRSNYFFIFYGVLLQEGKNLKPGNYVISSAMSIPEILEELLSGKTDRVTIIEGWNLRDIGQFLEEAGYGEKEDFYQLVGTPPAYSNGEVFQVKPGEITLDVSVLEDKPDNLSLEGYLFPDTYFINPGTTMEEVVRSIVVNLDKKITPDIREKVAESEFSLFEIITIASLIEKEVFLPEDKELVSGIIRKRMTEGLRLQIDATITYLTGRRSVQIPVTETRINSPYNTYFSHGLPKGPICNPGIESIKAALNPKESDYLFYLSKPDGETVFSRTHEEHVRAKNRYLR